MRITVQSNGLLTCDHGRFACCVGRTGLRLDKREGDGATPIGIWPLRRVLYRPDRLIPPPRTALPISPIGRQDGWCDDPAHADYNRPVTLPHPASCETLWRDDRAYDVVVILGHNDDPPQPGLGSAIFMHMTKPDRTPTAGCVALDPPDLLSLLSWCRLGDDLRIIP